MRTIKRKLSQQRNTRQQLEAYFNFGRSHKDRGQIQNAIEDFQAALTLANELKDKKEMTTANIELADVYVSNNEIEKAIEHYNEALKIAKRQNSKKGKILAYLGVGMIYSKLDGHTQKAIKCLAKASKISKARKYKKYKTKASIALGDTYRSNNQFQTANDHYQKAIKTAQKQGNKEDETVARLGYAHACKSMKKNDQAIENFQKALEIAKEQENEQHEEQICIGLGDALMLDSQIQNAIPHYSKALEIARKQEHKRSETCAYLGLGNAYKMSNQIPQAIENFDNALKIAKGTQDKRGETDAYLALGDVCISRNPIQETIQHYTNALHISRDQKDKRSEMDAQFKLGNAYTEDNLSAIHHYGEALEIAKAQGYKEQETQAYNALGDKYCSDNQIPNAIEHYKKALENARQQEEIKAHVGLGNAYLLSKQIKSAIKHFTEASKKAKIREYKLLETEAYLGMGNAYQSENQAQSVIFYERALEIAKEQGCKKLGKEAVKQLSKITGEDEEQKYKSIFWSEEPTILSEAPELWKWEKRSKVHHEKLMNLLEYAKTHPEEIQEINGVRVCCSEEFLIGKGSDGTRVYVGLGKDGVEKAVKRLLKDPCYTLAQQEKNVLSRLATMKSNHVVSYWFLDEQSDKEYLFLIVDLCEITLKEYVECSSEKDVDLVRSAPDIINQVLKGLVDLHEGPNPILHRDLKPSNILRDIQGNWLLADFGISRILMEDVTTHVSVSRGAEDWKAVESCSSEAKIDDGKSGNARYKRESDIQVAGMVAFYILTKGEHPFGKKPDRQRNLIDGKPVGLDMLKDDAAKDLISWMLSHDPKDRPSANEALKHPYLQPQEQQFELLCKVGNQPEIKKVDQKSGVVQVLNSNPKDWRNEMAPNVLTYLSTDCLKGKTFSYSSSWTDCLRLIRNIEQHWKDRPRPQPEAFYIVEDPQKYFLNLFPSLCVEVHKILRSCDWKERDDLKKYFCLKAYKSYNDIQMENGIKGLPNLTDKNNVENTHENLDSSKHITSSLRVRGTNGDETSKDLAVFQESDSKSKETKSNKEDIIHDEEKICQRFEDIFVDSKHKLKKEVHEKLASFSWVSGAYGLTAPTKKIARPHIYLTVKRGMKKSDVRRDLEDKFHCDAKLYFELLQEPKRKPKFEYLGKCSSTLRPKWMKSSSLPPAPGGGILACIRNNSTISEVNTHDSPITQGTGTLTMFCAHNNEHYALTCFHVGCATDETDLNATLNKEEDIEAIRSSLPTYVKYAKEQQYYFAEKVAKNNNHLIVFGDDGRKYKPLGDFHKHHFDNKCDIMSLKVTTNTKIKCTMTGVASPNWDSIGKELYERVFKGNDTVNVEKTGFSSDVSYGQIVLCNFNYKLGEGLLFQDAYVVKGYGDPFLKGGDSGSAVFFQDNNDEKQIFAYGVCEVDELPIFKRHESRSLCSHENAQAAQAKTPVKDECDNSSIWSEDEGDDSGVIFREEISGPYFICLSLHTALENLGLNEVTCVRECSLKRSETQEQLQF